MKNFEQNKKFSSLKGTALIKKSDLYFELLKEEKKNNDNKIFLFINYLKKSENKRELAKNCCSNEYILLLEENGLKINIKEKIMKFENKIEIKIIVDIKNNSKFKINCLNFELKSKSKFVKFQNTKKINFFLEPSADISFSYFLILKQNYFFEMKPIFFKFGTLKNLENDDLINNIYKQNLLLSLNKLIKYYKKEENTFQIINNLKKIKKNKIFNESLCKNDIQIILPNSIILKEDFNKIEFAVKISTIFGMGIIKIYLFEKFVIYELFSLFDNVVINHYAETIEFILENYN